MNDINTAWLQSQRGSVIKTARRPIYPSMEEMIDYKKGYMHDQMTARDAMVQHEEVVQVEIPLREISILNHEYIRQQRELNAREHIPSVKAAYEQYLTILHLCMVEQRQGDCGG